MMKRFLACSVIALVASLPACNKKSAPPAEPPAASATKPAPRSATPPATPALPAPAAPGTVVPAPVRPQPVVPAGFSEALALTDPDAREAALKQVLVNLPPGDAADMILARLPADALREKLLGTVLVNLAIQQPAAAANWLSAAPDFPEKPSAIRATADLWQRLDLTATVKWIETLPAGIYQKSALQAIANRIARTPAEHQSQELGAIANPTLRAEVQGMLPPAPLNPDSKVGPK